MRPFLQCMAVAAISVATLISNLQASEEALPLDKLPKAVTEAIKKMFPKAEMTAATKEVDGTETSYEVSIKIDGKKIDVTVEDNGEIEGLERQMDLKELPKIVLDAVAKKYPKSELKSAEAVYEIENGDEELEYYEIQIETADKKSIEVKVKLEVEFVNE